MTEYPNLFRPIDIAGLRIRNRIVKAPMCTNYATPDGFVTPEMIAYYRERARGGAGLVIVEFTYIDNIASKSWHRQLGAEDDDKIEGLSRLAAVIREQGAVSALQICHCGSQRLLPGGPPRVPSASAVSEGREVKEVDEAEIQQIVSDFGASARRGKEAGFDSDRNPRRERISHGRFLLSGGESPNRCLWRESAEPAQVLPDGGRDREEGSGRDVSVGHPDERLGVVPGWNDHDGCL